MCVTATNGPDESPRVTPVGHRVKLRRPVALGFVVARRPTLRRQTSTHIYIHTEMLFFGGARYKQADCARRLHAELERDLARLYGGWKREVLKMM